jgi:probable F420-dependent oxidoreductase
MRLGVSLAQAGRCADPASIRSAAMAAEQVGYSSLWVSDRLPAAAARWTSQAADGLAGREPGPGADDGPPAEIAAALDPLSVLTYAAAVTTRVRLGTSVLVAPWYRPALLARSLTSLHVLSEGRLTVGLGLGWSLDEFAAVGVPQQELGRRLDDALDMLGTVWGPRRARGEAAGRADGARVDPASTVVPIPGSAIPGVYQRPRPPVLLAAYTPDGLDRVARRADGWNPAGLPVDRLPAMWASVRDLAASHGREPDELELVVRANVAISDRPVDGERASYTGTVEQVAADISDTRRAGAHEVVLNLRGDHCLDQALDLYARLAETVDVTAMA